MNDTLDEKDFLANLRNLKADKVVANSPELFDLGQILYMRLPRGWQKGEAFDATAGSATFEQFNCAAAPEATIGFYCRGQRATDAAATAFSAMLRKPPHLLLRAEAAAISDILRNKCGADFAITCLETQEINGKNVLVVEGRHKDIDMDTLAMFIDTDETGSAVQEIYYQAPKAIYPRFLRDIRTAFKSIRWK